MALTDRIVVDSKILTGKPVVRGTRISVELVVELLAAGWSHAQILVSYPHLTEEDIRSCLARASFCAKRRFIPSGPHELETRPAQIVGQPILAAAGF
jgi:uncharacterized protein (DUF433 family)